MAAPSEGEYQREHEHVSPYPGVPLTLQLRTRLVLWYAGAIGSITALPWVAPVLADEGLSEGQIAATLLLLPVGQLLFAPAWSWMADRTDARTVIRWTTAGSALSGVALAAAPSAGFMVAALAVMSAFRGGVSPVGDALTLALLGEQRRSYGQIRAAGSIVFALVIGADGWLREIWPTGPLWIGAGLMGLAAAMSWLLPAAPTEAGRPGLADLARVARDPVIAAFAVIAVLHGMTITSYDSLYALHIEELGLPSTAAGASFTFGVVVEVVVLWTARRWLQAVGPVPLLAVAVASGIPRWWLTGTQTDPAVLALTQGLHGVGFGAWWAAGVALFNERVPRSLASSAQALFGVATFSIGYLAAMLAATVVLARWDTSTFFTGLAGVSAVALGLTLAAAFSSSSPRR